MDKESIISILIIHKMRNGNCKGSIEQYTNVLKHIEIINTIVV